MYVVKKAKQLEQDSLNRPEIERKQYYSNFLTDFYLRWCTCYKMIERFYEMKIIVDEITCNPRLINGITKPQEAKLKALILNASDWEIVESLKNILYPFYRSTLMLQGRKYETLALSKVFKLLSLILTND